MHRANGLEEFDKSVGNRQFAVDNHQCQGWQENKIVIHCHLLSLEENTQHKKIPAIFTGIFPINQTINVEV